VVLWGPSISEERFVEIHFPNQKGKGVGVINTLNAGMWSGIIVVWE
jgi:hypothetical protein